MRALERDMKAGVTEQARATLELLAACPRCGHLWSDHALKRYLREGRLYGNGNIEPNQKGARGIHGCNFFAPKGEGICMCDR